MAFSITMSFINTFQKKKKEKKRLNPARIESPDTCSAARVQSTRVPEHVREVS